MSDSRRPLVCPAGRRRGHNILPPLPTEPRRAGRNWTHLGLVSDKTSYLVASVALSNNFRQYQWKYLWVMGYSQDSHFQVFRKIHVPPLRPAVIRLFGTWRGTEFGADSGPPPGRKRNAGSVTLSNIFAEGMVNRVNSNSCLGCLRADSLLAYTPTEE
jgi:hypothetical protein